MCASEEDADQLLREYYDDFLPRCFGEEVEVDGYPLGLDLPDRVRALLLKPTTIPEDWMHAVVLYHNEGKRLLGKLSRSGMDSNGLQALLYAFQQVAEARCFSLAPGEDP